MKSSQPFDSGTLQFEGRTVDDALRRARQELGPTAAIRCWKVRRGGLLGFFERESFVAGLTPPVGAHERGDDVSTSRVRGSRAPGATNPWRAALSSSFGPLPETSSRAVIADLVEATTDEVVLGTDHGVGNAFREVLAQAEAALADQPETSEEQSAPDIGDGSEPVGRIVHLREQLLDIGVPEAYLPVDLVTLDHLVQALDRLGAPPPMVSAPGSLVIVVGTRRDVHATAAHVVSLAGLIPSDVITFQPTSEGRRRVRRRQRAGKPTVLAVEASPGSRSLAEVAHWIETLQPDQVLGAVSATLKRSDVERWRDALGRIDALALLRLAETATGAELMGVAPIALVEGRPATTLRWVVILLNLIEGAGI